MDELKHYKGNESEFPQNKHDEKISSLSYTANVKRKTVDSNGIFN